MKADARVTLEYCIDLLDSNVKATPATPCDTCNQMIQSNSATEQEIGEHDALHRLTFSLEGAALASVQKLLVGENVLTPSLATRGWKFWKSLPLTDEEIKKVEDASLKSSNHLTTTLSPFFDKMKKPRGYLR